MATFDQFINSIIADGNDGRAFEKFCKHFLETAPEYAHQFEKVWLWDDWPNKWSHDKGIDLIAKYKGRDTYCAIQSKCYASHNTVPYNEVTNFLADSSRTEIEDRILMMSTNKLNEKTSKEVISGQEKQVTILDRDYFENKAKFDYPSHISELGKAKAKPPVTPRKHQITAINDVEKGLQENDRGQLVMACGTGKTFTTLWIKERLKANTVLVLLPSLSLLSQTMREWVWGANERFEALAVCSDPTVGKSKNSDEDISTAEVGRVTWHIDEIRDFLRSPNPKVIFCTYQSSELIQLAQEGETIPQFDLVVCDEAHRCAGKANAGFATVLHEEKIRAKKRLFTTATPRYYGKSVKTAAEGRGVEIIGMDDEAKFGPVIHKLTFGQAIEMGMLTDYQVVVVGVDEPMVRDWIAEGEIVTFGDGNQTDARTVAAKIAVLKAIKDYDLNRVISFHTNIKRAKEFASDVFDVAKIIDVDQRPAGNIWSKHVDGTMSAGKRRDLINGLKELDGYEIGLLTNARCLSEGVDVPTLDGVAFVDPRGSQVDIIQAVGRAIRKSEDKSKGTIVLPVFLEAGDDPDTAIDASNFKPVWDVLKALRAHDEVLAEELDQYRTNLGLGAIKKSDKIVKFVFDLPANIDPAFSKSLTTKLVEAVTSSWNFWYGLLRAHYERTATTRVPAKYKTDDGYKLGGWVRKQRYQFDSLSVEQREKLNAFHDWTNDFYDSEFIETLEKIKSYFGKQGMPLELKGHPDWIRSFCNNYRQMFRKGNLSQRRIAALEAIKGWSWDPKMQQKETTWRTAMVALLEFKDTNGHLMVPLGYIGFDNFPLGNWVAGVRYKRDDLSKEEYTELERMDGWVWSATDARWFEGFVNLTKFLENNSIYEITPSTVLENGYHLGNWVKHQRGKKASQMPAERKKKLDDLDGWVWVPNKLEYQWTENFNILQQIVKDHGTLPPISQLSKKLYGWCNTQRNYYKAKKLELDKIKKLENLNGWLWSTKK